MDTVVVVEPAEEPVTLAEAKRHAGIDPELTADGIDLLIGQFIRAARRMLEKRLGRAFVTQTLETTWFGELCGDHEFRLPRAPVQSVVSVGFRVLGASEPEVVEPSVYHGSSGTPGMVRRVGRWPRGVGHATIRYVAGYGDAAAVPDEAKLAINMLVATWYGRREVDSNVQVYAVPKVVDMIVDSLRWGNYPL